MLRPRRFRPVSRTAQGVLLGLACGLFFLLIGFLGWTRAAEMSLSSLLFRLREPLVPDPSVILVVADNASVTRSAQWPLPRRTYAAIIARLNRAGAHTIALDVLFPAPSPYPADDAALARVCRQAGNVVQAVAFHLRNTQNSLPSSELRAIAPPPSRFQIVPHNAGMREADQMTPLPPSLLSSAPALGHLNVYPESDGVLRRLPHLIKYRGAAFPSLALAAATHFLGRKPADIVAGRDGVRIADRFVPLDQNGEAWINWVGGNRSFPTYSFNDVLDGRVQPEVFKGRVVLVGVTAWGAFDHRPTPFSPVQPAIELQANALENILQNRVLRLCPWWAQVAILLGLAAATGGLMAPQRAPGNTLLFFLLSLVALLGAMAALKYNVYIPLAAPLMAAALTYVLTVTLNYRQQWNVNWRTDTAVGVLARGGVALASGRERGQLQQVVCDVAREALSARHVFLISRRVLVQQPAARTALGEALRHVAAIVTDAGDSAGGTAVGSAAGSRLILWPEPRERHEMLQQPDEKQRQALQWLWRQIAEASESAPDDLILAAAHTAEPAKTPAILAALIPRTGDILIATGRTRSGEFTLRDALLLETLIKQAELSFENLEYYEQLQGRIVAADQELQEAHRLLIEQSTKLMAAVENIDSAMIVTDPRGNAIFVNSTSAEILREAAPRLGENVPDTLRAHGMEPVAALLDSPGAEKESCEIALQNGDGPHRVLSAQRTALDEGDATLGDMLIVSDVTTERELDQMKTEFVSFVSHELRSPLSAIYGYASLLQAAGDRFSVKERSDMVSSIVNQCKRLNRMISEMLDISRMEAGLELSLTRQPTDLVALCERVLQDARAALPPSSPHTLELRGAERPLRLNVDADRIEQILTNLVSNAVKYSPEGGPVTMTLEERGAEIEISVSDRGMGMTPQQMEHLFQKYYRTPEAQQSGIKGTGLGLFLARRLAQAHGGAITVESETGRGTTFHLVLPRSSARNDE